MGMELLESNHGNEIPITEAQEQALVQNPLLARAVAEPADRNPAAVYLARLSSPASRRTMRGALDTLARLTTAGRLGADTLPWGQLRYQHTSAMRAALANRYAPASTNKHLAALRGVLREAWRLGQMDADVYRRAIDVEPVRGERLPAGRELTGGELRALFELCAVAPAPAGARDAAMIAVLYAGGLRRSEAVALELADVDPATGEVRVQRGKGGKSRIVYLTTGGRAALKAWIAARGPEPGPLLCPVNKSGKVVVRRMTPQAAYCALRRRAAQAGATSFSPHDLRRSFVSHLLDAGADISTVQRLAGHASVTTTQRYDRRGEAAKRNAAELLHVPFRGGHP